MMKRQRRRKGTNLDNNVSMGQPPLLKFDDIDEVNKVTKAFAKNVEEVMETKLEGTCNNGWSIRWRLSRVQASSNLRPFGVACH